MHKLLPYFFAGLLALPVATLANPAAPAAPAPAVPVAPAAPVAPASDGLLTPRTAEAAPVARHKKTVVKKKAHRQASAKTSKVKKHKAHGKRGKARHGMVRR